MNFEPGKELIPSLQKTLSDYLKFSSVPAPSDTKEYTSFHNACKSALLHLALLIKLTQKENTSAPLIPDISNLLEQAKKELNTDELSGISLDLG